MVGKLEGWEMIVGHEPIMVDDKKFWQWNLDCLCEWTITGWWFFNEAVVVSALSFCQ